MADLTPFADRMNDVEIQANAGLSETLMRRLGSNINFLLDFLGVSDGATTPSGSLNNLANAAATADAHIMDNVANFLVGGGSQVVEVLGNEPRQEFLNSVLYLVITPDPGTTISFDFDWGSPTVNDMRLAPTTGGSAFALPQNVRNVAFGAAGDNALADAYEPTAISQSATSGNVIFSKMLNTGTAVLTSTEPGRIIFPLGVIDYRDVTANYDVDISLGGTVTNIPNAQSVQIYREYRLNVGSNAF